ncbi:hypothetical protein [Tsukamurella sp. PLM1]|uniref:hypothetical protein n=1 Tax=Tsukamurella sp. PLM1 TaxID=2929795 RepID=UPI00206F1106|nr:hypothetical protein [Tsukamurella sp. PLM1]BDH56620.1 hypothetical protein MTP03_15590 [Tsukamurella sp. PLM1]
MFSLASTTYSLLTGHPPNPYGFATVRRARPDLLPQVDGVLARATARGAESRFASAAEYAAALTAALDAVEQPVPAPALSAAAPAAPGRGPVQTAAPVNQRERRFEVPEAALPIVFLLLVVLVAAGFMALFLSGS